MDATLSPSSRLTESQRERFEHDGYLCPLRALNDAEVKKYLACYMDYTERNKVRLDALQPNQRYQVLSETHFVLPWAYEIASHPHILDAVESILGPHIIAWNTNWFTKMPGEKTFVS